MYLKNLVAAVEQIDQMPIEVEEMAAKLVEAGCQDKIIFHPADEDPDEFQGVFYKYVVRHSTYADPEFTTLIAFSKHLPIEWQRMVCCKELIHTCDSSVEKTDSPEEVEALLEKVLGPLSTQDFGLADVMAAKDKLAIYQALAILFPPKAREQAVAGLAAGMRIEEIAAWAGLPRALVSFACSEDWPAVMHELIEGWE
ncbi:hypothetical protein [Ferirhizobium litorale]|uniref:Uncharacterized protein n=1 Tax=Ferirhizobium litorale TaxID=2927786 RepID=A0AAE3QH57_9HYPH|nr:hypothetical protein [Fererhizobium litorale]MDI7923420.1 hypothetical protein [Fererhizobium litorale]